MDDLWTGEAIALLLPLTAILLMVQTNPYHALVLRGIVGAVAALVYAVFGAADVALTEALVGTMLSITLYAVAVRSSLNMKVGVLQEQIEETATDVSLTSNTSLTTVELALDPLFADLRQILKPYHLRIETVPYANLNALQTGLATQEIHTAILPISEQAPLSSSQFTLQTRVQRLYEIMKADLPNVQVTLTPLSDLMAQQAPSQQSSGAAENQP